MGIYGDCFKTGCKEKLHGLNSKQCKLCGNSVCIDHLEYLSHDCPKVIYEKYIKKEKIRDTGVNLSTGIFGVVCETCGYASEYPKLIENAGEELESHLDSNPNCKNNKKTYLKRPSTSDPFDTRSVKSSIVRDPNRNHWVCSLCRPPRKFSNHEEYLAHHFTHS